LVFIISASIACHGRSVTVIRPVLAASPLYFSTQRAVVAWSTSVNH
jgi:hypothetical protein